VPRTWGYIIIGVAALVGIGALLLPMPERVEIEPPLAPEVKRPPKTIVQPQPKPAQRQKHEKPAPPPPKPKTFPRDDTTKTRTLMQPAT